MQYSQEHLKTMVYAEFGGQTECIMGNWKIENGERKIRKRGVDDKNAKDRTTGRGSRFFSPLIVHWALTIFRQDKTRLKLTLLQPDIT